MRHDCGIALQSGNKAVRVWDAPTRLFHWSVVGLVLLSWLSADQGYMRVHLYSGLSLLALLAFRICWGVVGSTTARFTSFLHPPATVIAYLKTLARGRGMVHAGHNPAGGLMVIAFLAILLAQVATGLFANDGLKFSGPLALLVSDDLSDRLTQIHSMIFNVILALVWLHVVAIGFYWLVKGDNLIGAMVSGRKDATRVPEGTNFSFAHPLLAIGLLLACAIAAASILF